MHRLETTVPDTRSRSSCGLPWDSGTNDCGNLSRGASRNTVSTTRSSTWSARRLTGHAASRANLYTTFLIAGFESTCAKSTVSCRSSDPAKSPSRSTSVLHAIDSSRLRNCSNSFATSMAIVAAGDGNCLMLGVVCGSLNDELHAEYELQQGVELAGKFVMDGVPTAKTGSRKTTYWWRSTKRMFRPCRS